MEGGARSGQRDEWRGIVDRLIRFPPSAGTHSPCGLRNDADGWWRDCRRGSGSWWGSLTGRHRAVPAASVKCPATTACLGGAVEGLLSRMFHGIPATRTGTGEGLLSGRKSRLRTSRCFTWNIDCQSRFMFHVEHHLLCSLMMFHVEHSVVMRLFGRCRTSLTTLSSHPKYLVRSDPPVGVAGGCTAPHSARHLAGGAIRHRRRVAVSPTSAHHVEGARSVGSLR
ncbi:hypothetical protein RN50_01626 [Microbacterium foliorum]|uniref:Uncharacterized protein n=1 Tax=Microbacterium foliorum TaxID=104336 RepID=A0A0F0KLJ8_9MICO|nr:hypothetical protein RN50_01626 [Microbacterium foliorum]